MFVFLFQGTSRRRTAARVSYVNMINGEGSSSLLTRLKIQEDIEERERRRIREKEKKEANLVLLQDLAVWEEKELGPDVVKQLHSMWEVNVIRIYWEFNFVMKCVFSHPLYPKQFWGSSKWIPGIVGRSFSLKLNSFFFFQGMPFYISLCQAVRKYFSFFLFTDSFASWLTVFIKRFSLHTRPQYHRTGAEFCLC